jgi:protein-S-isoprenylcysteine O-methyltransferase Ste14
MWFGLVLALHLYWLFVPPLALLAFHVFRAQREGKILQEAFGQTTSIIESEPGVDP